MSEEIIKSVITSHADWEAKLGEVIGQSSYLKIPQGTIDKFAEATGDHQWIHTDPARAAVESQFKSTIAHGYLTVSLVPKLLWEVVNTENAKMTVNYGIENFKFNQAVLVDSEVRLVAKVGEVKNLRGRSRVKLDITMEIKGEKKPAYTGTIVFVYLWD